LKVSETQSGSSGILGLPARDDKKVNTAGNADFRSQLVKAEDSNYEMHLERLVRDIISQGDVLAKRVDIRELKVYKRLISEFLELALGNSKKFSKKSMLDRRGRRKVYAIIKNINVELDQLTEDILSGEKNNIGLLKRLDDIRGLILDLFM